MHSYINQLIYVQGECCRPSTILIIVSTHRHLIPSKTLSSSKFKHRILNQPQLVFRGKDIYNLYIKYTFSVNDHSCIGSTLKVLNFNHDLTTGERFSFMTQSRHGLCSWEEADSTPQLSQSNESFSSPSYTQGVHVSYTFSK